MKTIKSFFLSASVIFLSGFSCSPDLNLEVMEANIEAQESEIQNLDIPDGFDLVRNKK